MNKQKVLIVDDNSSTRMIVRNVLESMDYDIAGEAQDGMEALDLLSNGLTPDIITMDIEMPNMDGIEATRHIIENYPDMKILIVSSHSDQKALQAITVGATALMSKPITRETIVQALEKMEKMAARTKLNWG